MKTRRAEATLERRLRPESMTCPECGETLRIGYTHWRKVATLEGLWCLKVSMGRCEHPACARYHRSAHPLEEGHLVLPHDEYGLDVGVFIGAHRYQTRASTLQIHAALRTHPVPISQRNVRYLLERYDERVALSVRHPPERCARLDAQGRLILAMDGWQPEVGHEVLWVIREVLSAEVLAVRRLLSSSHGDLAALLREAVAGFSAPVVGVVSDGQPSIGQAVAAVFPGVPHQ
jgi:hypothetical protein